MEALLQDLRYALRSLLRERGFTVVAVLTLALGIGANASIFSFLDALLLRPFDFPRMERLVYLAEQSARSSRLGMSAASLALIREGVPSLEFVAAFQPLDVNLTGAGEPARLYGCRASPTFFTTLGVSAALGRALVNGEDQEGRDRVVVLSHTLWQSQFGGEPGVLGRTVLLDGEPYTVVGVMPPDFRFPRAVMFWVPMVPLAPTHKAYREHRLGAVAWLKEGRTLEQVHAELGVAWQGLAAEDPGHRLTALPLQDVTESVVRQMLWIFMAVVVLVLLVACANVAGMLLARSVQRSRELAIRASLGAGRGRVVRLLLTESLVLAVMGGGLGLLFAMWGIDVLHASMPADLALYIPGWSRVGLDWRVLGYTCAAVLASTLLFGLIPALRASQLRPALVLWREVRGGGSRQRLRQVLVATQVALALVLSVGAALNVRSFSAMLREPLGFQGEGLLTLRFRPGQVKYPDAASVSRFYDEAVARLRALPGVHAAAAASVIPMGRSWNLAPLRLEGAEPTPGAEPRVMVQVVTEDFFKTLGLSLREGAFFTGKEGAEASPVAVISESLARRYFGKESPVGQRLSVGTGADGQPRWNTVIGVVADARHTDFLSQQDPFLVLYLPLRQESPRELRLLLRAQADPMALVPQVRRELLAMEPDQPLTEIKSFEHVMDETLLRARYSMVLLMVFAGIALLLSAVGIYGVMAYTVRMRTHEIGVRMALGARARDVTRMVVLQGLWPTLVGVAVGLVGAWASTRVLAGTLYGVSPLDPLLFTLTALFFIAVALLAALIPVRHATRVDPIDALRAE
jgi:predicted permease